MNSILDTVDVAAFDSATGQLSAARHHLVSAQKAYATSFSRRCTLVFDPPPPTPYDGATTPTRPRKKRKRSRTEFTALEYLEERDHVESHLSTTDRESDLHHAKLVLDLEPAVDAVRQHWTDTHSESQLAVDWTRPVHDNLVNSAWTYRDRDHSVDNARELGLVDRCSNRSDRAQDGTQVVEWDANTTRGCPFDGARVNLSHSDELVVQVYDCDDQLDNGEEAEPLAEGFTVVLPPSSGFFVSNFDRSWTDPASAISKISTRVGGWDILIIDPPWPNASATRSAAYETFDPYRLWELDVPALLGTSKPVLVAIWLTNRVKYRRLLLDKLFPAWKIENAVEWYWVKIAAQTGEPVWSLESRHRRCYEGLVVGWYNPTQQQVTPLPDQKTFLSTPIGHSRKPVLFDLLVPLLPASQASPNVIELFARTTLAGPQCSPHRSDDATRAVNAPSADLDVVVQKDDDDNDDKRQGVGIERGGGGELEQGRRERRHERKRGFFFAVGNEAIKFNLSVERDKRDKFKGWIELD